MSSEGARTYVRINKVVSGWTWSIQVVDDVTAEELQEAKDKALRLNQELVELFIPEPDEPEF